MTAKVSTVSESGYGSDEYEDGHALDVIDGHLFVRNDRKSGHPPVAVYAPGRWTRAEIVTAST